jgi:hypothetical protein
MLKAKWESKHAPIEMEKQRIEKPILHILIWSLIVIQILSSFIVKQPQKYLLWNAMEEI